MGAADDVVAAGGVVAEPEGPLVGAMKGVLVAEVGAMRDAWVIRNLRYGFDKSVTTYHCYASSEGSVSSSGHWWWLLKETRRTSPLLVGISDAR